MLYKKHILTIKILIDISLAGVASFLAFWVRLDGMLSSYVTSLYYYSIAALCVKLILILGFRTHQQVWRHSSIQDLFSLIKLCGIFIMVQSTLLFLFSTWISIPRSIPTLDGIATLVLLGAMRLIWRYYGEKDLFFYRHSDEFRQIIIIGAGEAGAMIAKVMLKHPEAGMKPIGFLDDDLSKYDQKIMGLPVFGNIQKLTDVAGNHKVDEIIIAIPSAPGNITREVVNIAQKAGLPFRIIPGLYEVVSGNVSISSIREIKVEDLLKRDPIRLDLANIASYLQGKTILVTGAGGSIGSELVRQVSRFNPGHIILLGRGENSLFNIENQVNKTFPDISFSTVVCDIRNSRRVQKIFRDFRPLVVFHAAAHKHVPMMEKNAEEAVLNNIGGTQNLVKCALEFEVLRFVNISTDKAVNPTSIMGASKRAAEMVVRKAAACAKQEQSFISVRFGNVLGSRGSVIPMFKEQISRGGPVTVTHPEMQRYFMTIPEASQLVLQAAGMNNNGTVYVLDMGEPVKILDLAKDLIRLSGLEPFADIDITYTGIRPGEKLYEELLTAEEGTMSTKHDKIFSAKSSTLPQDLDEKMDILFAAAHSGDRAGIYKAFENIVPKSNFDYLRNVKVLKNKDKLAENLQEFPQIRNEDL